VQLNKWGFVPGGDDTLELNLMTKGALIACKGRPCWHANSAL